MASFILKNLNLNTVYEYMTKITNFSTNFNTYTYNIIIVNNINNVQYLLEHNKTLYEIFTILFKINNENKIKYQTLENIIIAKFEILDYFYYNNNDWEYRVKFAQLYNLPIDARIKNINMVFTNTTTINKPIYKPTYTSPTPNPITNTTSSTNTIPTTHIIQSNVTPYFYKSKIISISTFSNLISKNRNNNLWKICKKYVNFKIKSHYNKIITPNNIEYNYIIKRFIYKMFIYSTKLKNLSINDFTLTSNYISNQSMEYAYEEIEKKHPDLKRKCFHVVNNKIIFMNNKLIHNIIQYISNFEYKTVTLKKYIRYRSLCGFLPLLIDDCIFIIKFSKTYMTKQSYTMIIYAFLVNFCNNINVKKIIIYNPYLGLEYYIEENINYQEIKNAIDKILDTYNLQ